MPKFKVQLAYTQYSTCETIVTARNEKRAREKAIDKAHQVDLDFEQQQSDYDILSIEKDETS